MTQSETSHLMRNVVRRQYGATARASHHLDKEQTGRVAGAFGYSEADLSVVPETANLGLSCGNPIAHAGLRPGETVVDLGSGGGMDVILAASHVGPQGVVIGVDMTEEMIALAERNTQKTSLGNVEFRLGEIDKMPIEDQSVDCVISNCVVNLCEDKDAVFRDVFRILRPGGRIALGDIVLTDALPRELKTSVEALVGCIGGAVPADRYRDGLIRAGFVDVQVIDKSLDLNIYSEVDGQSGCCRPGPAPSCCGPSDSEIENQDVHQSLQSVMRSYDLNQFAASAIVLAKKPG